jgi:hypothetical protein
MALDSTARNRLFAFVTVARRAVSADLAEQMQSAYGLMPDGRVASTESLQSAGRSEAEIGVAKVLAQRLEHLVAQTPEGPERRALAFARLARELSFGIVNRLAAVRMAEKRSLLQPSLASGLTSKDSSSSAMSPTTPSPRLTSATSNSCAVSSTRWRPTSAR